MKRKSEKVIVIAKKVKPKNPILIAAWPGMGHVAVKAASFLKEKLQAQLFAKLDSKEFFYQNDVTVNNSIIQLSGFPDGKFYYWENKFGKNDLVIFLSELQPPPEKAVSYAQAIIDFAASLKVKTIFTFAAMLSSIEHTQMPKAWFAVTHQRLIAEFQGIDIRPLESGQVSGLNGMFLGITKKNKIEGACLLGEIPFYAVQIENPRSAWVVLNALSKFLDIKLDLNELSLAGKVMEEEITKLIDHVKDPLLHDDQDHPITSEDVDKMRHMLATHSQIPNSAKRQIEDLFQLAEKDLSCAVELKKKLDEWNAYKDYEDRFLGLFKKGDERDN